MDATVAQLIEHKNKVDIDKFSLCGIQKMNVNWLDVVDNN